MRFISSLDQHPERRKQRFPEHLWPRSDDPKEVDELWILIEFTAAARLRLDCAPIKRQPPLPDLECVIDGNRRLFELGEVIECDLAEGIAYSGKQAFKKMEAISRGHNDIANSIETAGFRSFSANASLERILRKKLVKAYETEGLQADLLLFYDQQMILGPFDYIDQWKDELSALVRKSVFQRVWIFALQSTTLIGYLEAPEGRGLRAICDWRFHFDLRAP